MADNPTTRTYYGAPIPRSTGPHPDPTADRLYLINQIVRDVCEIERDPLPDQPHGEMRVTVDELVAILESRLP